MLTYRRECSLDPKDDLDLIYQAKHLFDSLGLGLVVTGEDWRFLYVNPAFSSMVGSRPDDTVGRSIDKFVPADELPPWRRLEGCAWLGRPPSMSFA